MKLLLTVLALAAFTHAAPTTHTMEVGSNGIVGSVDSPLISIVVNILNNQETPAVLPGAVLESVAEPQPVHVVDTPAIEPQPVTVVDSAPVNVVDSPLQPNPIDIISVSPIEANPIDIISVNPGAAPNPIDVISVSPVELNPIDVISVSPDIVEPTPVNVVEVNPEVIAEPGPVQVVDVTPGLASVVPEASGSQIINVIFNFVFGSDGSVSSVEVPAQAVQQIVGAHRQL